MRAAKAVARAGDDRHAPFEAEVRARLASMHRRCFRGDGLRERSIATDALHRETADLDDDLARLVRDHDVAPYDLTDVGSAHASYDDIPWKRALDVDRVDREGNVEVLLARLEDEHAEGLERRIDDRRMEKEAALATRVSARLEPSEAVCAVGLHPTNEAEEVAVRDPRAAVRRVNRLALVAHG